MASSAAMKKNVTRLRNLSWTEAERSQAKNYAAGLVVQFQRNGKGFAIGEKAKVAGIENGAVLVEKKTAQNSPCRLKKLKTFPFMLLNRCRSHPAIKYGLRKTVSAPAKVENIGLIMARCLKSRALIKKGILN